MIERFRASTKSRQTSYIWEFSLNRLMRHFLCAIPLSEPTSDSPEAINKFNRARAKGQLYEYHYELLIDFFTPEQIQEMLIHFVMSCREPRSKYVKKVRAASLENYLSAMEKFFRINGKKGIDWDVIREFKGEHVKAVADREYPFPMGKCRTTRGFNQRRGN